MKLTELLTELARSKYHPDMEVQMAMDVEGDVTRPVEAVDVRVAEDDTDGLRPPTRIVLWSK